MHPSTHIKRLTIIILGLILMSSVSSFSYAYWASNVETTIDSDTANVDIGTWTFCNLIYTPQEFFDFATSTTSLSTDYYCLANDIDFSTFTWTYTTAHASNIFRGTLDGRGHTLSNIAMESTSTVKSYMSLFNILDGSTIQNLNIDNFSFAITNAFFTSVDITSGILGGKVEGNPVTIENIRVNNADLVSNIVEGAGGLTGQIEANTNVTFRNIKIRGLTVLNSSKRVGGLFSRLNSGTGTVIVEDVDIIANLAAGATTTYTGGIAGTVRVATFYASRVVVEYVAQGSIDLLDITLNYTSSNYTGGLVGNNNSGSVMIINDSFFTGELYNNYTYAGALLGRKKAAVTFDESFYSNVFFVNTYTAPVNNNVVHGTMVNEQSMPNVTWWNTFSDDFDTATLWQQDGTGRLTLID